MAQLPVRAPSPSALQVIPLRMGGRPIVEGRHPSRRGKVKPRLRDRIRHVRGLHMPMVDGGQSASSVERIERSITPRAASRPAW